jgi:hypothetical protein
MRGARLVLLDDRAKVLRKTGVHGSIEDDLSDSKSPSKALASRLKIVVEGEAYEL